MTRGVAESRFRYLAKRPSKAEYLAWKDKAEAGDPFCAYLVGRCCEEGWCTTANTSKALFWYRTASDGGCPEAYYFAGSLLAFGPARLHNAEVAFEYFRLGADAGDRTAVYQLGNCYLDGDGVEVDSKKAVRLFRTAARLGSADGFLMLGWLCEQGIVRGGLSAAKRHYQEALRLGDRAAEVGLARLRSQKQRTKRSL